MENKAKITINRSSSIELLRIIAMFLIVMHHFLIHSNFSFENTSLSMERFYLDALFIGGKIGVNIFVIISGYFLIRDTGYIFNVKRIFKLWNQVIFYSLTLLVVYILLGNNPNIKQVIHAFFPITTNTWWFPSAYFVLYILHPFLNKMLLNLDRNAYRFLLILLFFMWSVVPTFTKLSFLSNTLTYFFFLYSVAGYIRLYGAECSGSFRKYIKMCLFTLAITYFLGWTFILLGTKWSFFVGLSHHIYEQTSTFTLIISLFLFIAFTKLNLSYSKIINIIASATFGIYLIHESALIAPYLWTHVFSAKLYQNSLYIIPYSLVAICLVFTVCGLLDILRKYTFEKILMSIISKKLDNLNYSINEKIYSKYYKY